MNPQDDDTSTRTGLWVVFATVTTLLIGLIIWILKGPDGATDGQPAPLHASAAGHNASNGAHGHGEGGPLAPAGSGTAHGAASADAAGTDGSQTADTGGAPGIDSAGAADEASQFVAFENIDAGELASIIHFASASAALPAESASDIATVIDALQASPNRRVLLAGFHDPTGNHDFNQALARKRALAVRDALLAQGIAPVRVLMRKPEQTTGSGTNAEARRVEMRLID